MRTNVYVDGFNLYYGCLKERRTAGSTWRRCARGCCRSARSTAFGTSRAGVGPTEQATRSGPPGHVSPRPGDPPSRVNPSGPLLDQVNDDAAREPAADRAQVRRGAEARGEGLGRQPCDLSAGRLVPSGRRRLRHRQQTTATSSSSSCCSCGGPRRRVWSDTEHQPSRSGALGRWDIEDDTRHGMTGSRTPPPMQTRLPHPLREHLRALSDPIQGSSWMPCASAGPQQARSEARRPGNCTSPRSLQVGRMLGCDTAAGATSVALVAERPRRGDPGSTTGRWPDSARRGDRR